MTGSQRELLDLILDQRGEDAHDATIPVVQRDGTPLPLSFAQERLWFLHELEEESAFYNLTQAYRVRGMLDEAALERSMVDVMWRHEVLRTRIENRDGRAVAVVAAEPSFALTRIDL